MTTKTICDNCGADDAGRFIVDVSASMPLRLKDNNDRGRRDYDFCTRCTERFLSVINALVPPKKPS